MVALTATVSVSKDQQEIRSILHPIFQWIYKLSNICIANIKSIYVLILWFFVFEYLVLVFSRTFSQNIFSSSSNEVYDDQTFFDY